MAKTYAITFHAGTPWRSLDVEADFYEYDEHFVTFKVGPSGNRKKVASFDKKSVVGIQERQPEPGN